jgi:hypothetical protein
MSVLRTLQARTFPRWQMFGFALTLFIGLIIIGMAGLLYSDIGPLLRQEQALFGKQSIVISKKVSVLKTLNKDKIYFNEDELADLRSQAFIGDVSPFEKARFEVQAFTKQGENIPGFKTDLFFEAIPDEYMDVQTKEWVWTPASEELPIIVPQDYISLYNFGFAESQGLPVISKNAIGQVQFGIRISGRGKRKELRGRIVGFSEEINSILVPLPFLKHANAIYGEGGSARPSRLLISLSDPSDESALVYFEDQGLDVGKGDLERNRLWFFFKILFIFLLVISSIIILLSASAILMSMNILLYKNKETINNLYLLGYPNAQIGKFYYLLVSAIIIITGLLAMGFCNLIHHGFTEKMESIFDLEAGPIYALIIPVLCLLLILIYIARLSSRLRTLNSAIV